MSGQVDAMAISALLKYWSIENVLLYVEEERGSFNVNVTGFPPTPVCLQKLLQKLFSHLYTDS